MARRGATFGTQAVQELLLHKEVLLKGCILRVTSLESRMQNMINLVSMQRASRLTEI